MEDSKHSKSSPQVRLEGGSVLDGQIEKRSLARMKSVEKSEVLSRIHAFLGLTSSSGSQHSEDEKLSKADRFAVKDERRYATTSKVGEEASLNPQCVEYLESLEAASEDSFSTSLETISQGVTPPTSNKVPRYTAVDNPAGNRKYQKWLKTTALAKLVEDAKVKMIEGGKAVIVVKEPEVHTQKVSVATPQDVPNTTQRHITKFSHGRKHKAVYKGPICYKCSGKHHIRDCGARLLKGKRNRKATAKF